MLLSFLWFKHMETHWFCRWVREKHPSHSCSKSFNYFCPNIYFIDLFHRFSSKTTRIHMLSNNIFNSCMFFHLRWWSEWRPFTRVSCKTNSSSTPQNITRATEALKKTEPLISAGIIGFSLLTIALIFPKDSEPNGVSDLSINDTLE